MNLAKPHPITFCPVCQMTFNSVSAYVRHRNIYAVCGGAVGPPPWKCAICRKRVNRLVNDHCKLCWHKKKRIEAIEAAEASLGKRPWFPLIALLYGIGIVTLVTLVTKDYYSVHFFLGIAILFCGAYALFLWIHGTRKLAAKKLLEALR